MSISSRTLKIIDAGIAVAVAATVISLQVTTLQVASNAVYAAESAKREITYGDGSIEDVTARSREVSIGETETLVDSPLIYTSWSMSYTHRDGSLVTSGGFDLGTDEYGAGITITPRASTLPGTYTIVVDQLAPSEIDRIVFLITVPDSEGGN